MDSVLIAIPARDEEQSVARCLRSVLRAAYRAIDLGSIERVAVAVSAHRCLDRTYAVAAQTLADSARLDWMVLRDDTARDVGATRAALIDAAADQWPWLTDSSWVLNTDADSTVPPEWAASLLAHARRTGADALAGLVALEDWVAPRQAQQAYDDILRRGLRGLDHDHVYCANLAVQLGAYRRVGGFRSLDCGEDRDLLTRMSAAGMRVVSITAPVVATSARVQPRATGGLGTLLGCLTSSAGAPRMDARPSG